MTADDVIREWRDAAKGYLSAHTSGSTGAPRDILLDKGVVRASALRTNKFFGITRGSLLYSGVSPEYIGGKMMAIRGEVAGCDVIFENPSNRLALSAPRKIDLLAVVPSQMWGVLESLERGVVPEIGAVIIGGAPLGKDLRERIIASGITAYETYGMTETASHIALKKVAPDSDCFIAMEGISVECDDRGCLVINVPELGRIVTNDLAELVSPSSFRILGRHDNVIISGGKKIVPEEIEALASHYFPGVELAASSVPDHLWGEKLVLVATAPLPDAQIQAFSQSLEPHKRPKDYITLPALPKSPNGKLLRPTLREKLKSL